MKIKKLTFKKLNRDVFLLYCLLAVIIFQSGTVQAAINSSSLFFGVTRLLMMLIAAFFSVKCFKIISQKEKKMFILLTLFLEIMAIINFVLYPKSVVELQYKIFLFLMLFLVLCWTQKKDIKLDCLMYNVLFVIAQVTLVMYFLIEIVQLPIPYTIFQGDMDTGTPHPYKNYFDVFYSYSPSFPPRMSGLFWEPGVNQIYLNLALLLYYILGKKSKYQLGVLVTTIIFTQSSMGYMIMSVLLAIIISSRLNVKKYTKLIINLFFYITGFVCACMFFLNKKEQSDVFGDSYAVRLADFYLGMRLFIENPIIGIGFYNTDVFSTLRIYSHGNSNGLLTVMYTTGILGIIFLVAPYLYKLLFLKENQKKVETVITLLFVLAININEPIYSLPIMMYILAREYSSIS